MARKDRSLRSRLRSFIFAVRGVRDVFLAEPNAMIHVIVALAVIVFGVLLKLPRTDFALITIAIAMVFVSETFNTAIERLTDLVSPESHPLAGQVKDIAAGAVLLASIAAATIGAIVFLPRMLELCA